jgi:hypothetical protein
MIHGMKIERFNELMADEKLQLTRDECKEWHFCLDWDGLLIHKDDEEFTACSCPGGMRIKGQFADRTAGKSS